MNIQIDINTDNDIFKGSDLVPEVLTILNSIRNMIQNNFVRLDESGIYPLHETNGNRCGTFIVIEDASKLEEIPILEQVLKSDHTYLKGE